MHQIAPVFSHYGKFYKFTVQPSRNILQRQPRSAVFRQHPPLRQRPDHLRFVRHYPQQGLAYRVNYHVQV